MTETINQKYRDLPAKKKEELTKMLQDTQNQFLKRKTQAIMSFDYNRKLEKILEDECGAMLGLLTAVDTILLQLVDPKVTPNMLQALAGGAMMDVLNSSASVCIPPDGLSQVVQGVTEDMLLIQLNRSLSNARRRTRQNSLSSRYETLSLPANMISRPSLLGSDGSSASGSAASEPAMAVTTCLPGPSRRRGVSAVSQIVTAPTRPTPVRESSSESSVYLTPPQAPVSSKREGKKVATGSPTTPTAPAKAHPLGMARKAQTVVKAGPSGSQAGPSGTRADPSASTQSRGNGEPSGQGRPGLPQRTSTPKARSV